MLIKKIGKYEVLDVLGKGGMGMVYKATDPAIGRLVAIKMITSGLVDDANYLKRFKREAQATGKLQHQNLVVLYDLGDQDGTPFLVMEYLEGETLQSILNARRDLPLLEKLDLIAQTCSGLHYAHEHGLVHRDIKPANLMKLRDGLLKIVDFGIARLEGESVTLPGQVLGSIDYMSPEQISGSRVDCRTDIFSAGVVLYQLLTNALPFHGKDTGSTLLKIIKEPPPPLENFLKVYPPGLELILQRALAKSREERYATAEEFAFDLNQTQDELKRELVSQSLAAAEDFIVRSDVSKAKEQCLRILKLDRQNRRASELLKEMQHMAQDQTRSEQARQMHSQAEAALAKGQFEGALRCLEQAILVDPQNTELQNLREQTRQAKAQVDATRDAIRRAESAQRSGDLDDALAAVQEALGLNANDSEAKTLHVAIRGDIAERDRQLRQPHSAIQEKAVREMAGPEARPAVPVPVPRPGAVPSPTLNVPSPGATSLSAHDLTPDAIDRAGRILASYVGPVAGFLTKKAAQRADSLHTFHLALAEHVEDKVAQAQFLNEVNRPRTPSERAVGGKPEARITHDTFGATALQPHEGMQAQESDTNQTPARPILVASQPVAQSAPSGWIRISLGRVRGIVESLRRGWHRLLF